MTSSITGDQNIEEEGRELSKNGLETSVEQRNSFANSSQSTLTKQAATGLVLLVAGLASFIIAVPVADQTAQSKGCPLPQGAGEVQVE
ncbi:hypothetical protein ElyMa_002172200 [Elysia marginata]|uniref:Uncharacterized protein n=1 Tax=Elysia marginata TaxID=1093978 RepID=A0AAV4FNC2_9GAST|nr:hypothetical protein ElyMa_002172200 [Elysia marginata]